MKILLINPITENISLASPDLGLGYLASALKKENHEVNILDCVNRRFTFRKFEDYITGVDFDVIGFRVFSTDLPSVKKSLQITRRIHPDAKIILGGAHPSAFPEQTLGYFDEADFALRGEAEKGLTDLVRSFSAGGSLCVSGRCEEIPGLIRRENGTIKCNPPVFIENLDSLGSPDWRLIDPRDYPYQTSYLTESRIIAPLIMTRGCPYRCTFCSCRSVTGHKIRSHSVSYMIEEMKFLKSEFGIGEVCFIDDNFLALKDTAAELCEEMIRQKIGLKWSSFGIRLDLVDREILHLMKKSGCYLLTVGIESGSQRILDHMKKRLTIDLIREKTKLIHNESRIKMIGNFILGYPPEKEEDIRKTINLATELPLYGANFFPFHPTPGTEIFDQLSARKDFRITNWEKMGQDRKPYIPEGISQKKFIRLFYLAFIKFYLRPRVILNVLNATRSVEKLKYIFNRIFKIAVE